MIDNIAHKLRIKYGLRNYPTEEQVSTWLKRVGSYNEQKIEPEVAGRRAALDAFGELDAVILFSRADTIQALLAQAVLKDQTGSANGEKSMRNTGAAFRVKYKLADMPTEVQAAEWVQLVETLIQEGVEPEVAGQQAAEALFHIDEGLVLKAEADTIEALLAMAKKK